MAARMSHDSHMLLDIHMLDMSDDQYGDVVAQMSLESYINPAPFSLALSTTSTSSKFTISLRS
jgi:hypothetical protein